MCEAFAYGSGGAVLEGASLGALTQGRVGAKAADLHLGTTDLV
jgi:hypothetical protein